MLLPRFKMLRLNRHLLEFKEQLAHSRADAAGTPSFRDFLGNIGSAGSSTVPDSAANHPYIHETHQAGKDRRVYFETYGCQMNTNDTEIAKGVLKRAGFREAKNANNADVILLMTCAIREGAEQKIWKRLEQLKLRKLVRSKRNDQPPLKIGILGCMAERLKQKILEKESAVDIIAGPDSYRDLPRLLSVAENGQQAANVLLSLEETYADVTPVRINPDSVTAFVSIMRGCDNMCTYCIVPFTRGRERSRPVDSILDEIRRLSDQGVKEVTLLGQNVNSYRDLSESTHYGVAEKTVSSDMPDGFRTVYKPKQGGRRFADLLEKVANVDPEMRIRFTSPHPKDFPDEVLFLIRDSPNICNQLHMPAQSGSNSMLEAMRRGYTKEAYLNLIQHVREIIPDVSLTSDFIAGFCGEKLEDHQATIDLIHQVKYTFCYCFPYSMREKTPAHRRLQDDVPTEIKKERAVELIEAFRQDAEKLNRFKIGNIELALVEGKSRRTATDMQGRTESGVKVIMPNQFVVSTLESDDDQLLPLVPGNYVAVEILDANSQSLHGIPLFHTSLRNFETNLKKFQRSSEKLKKREKLASN